MPWLQLFCRRALWPQLGSRALRAQAEAPAVAGAFPRLLSLSPSSWCPSPDPQSHTAQTSLCSRCLPLGGRVKSAGLGGPSAAVHGPHRAAASEPVKHGHDMTHGARCSGLCPAREAGGCDGTRGSPAWNKSSSALLHPCPLPCQCPWAAPP